MGTESIKHTVTKSLVGLMSMLTCAGCVIWTSGLVLLLHLMNTEPDPLTNLEVFATGFLMCAGAITTLFATIYLIAYAVKHWVD